MPREINVMDVVSFLMLMNLSILNAKFVKLLQKSDNLSTSLLILLRFNQLMKLGLKKLQWMENGHQTLSNSQMPYWRKVLEEDASLEILNGVLLFHLRNIPIKYSMFGSMLQSVISQLLLTIMNKTGRNGGWIKKMFNFISSWVKITLPSIQSFSHAHFLVLMTHTLCFIILLQLSSWTMKLILKQESLRNSQRPDKLEYLEMMQLKLVFQVKSGDITY